MVGLHFKKRKWIFWCEEIFVDWCLFCLLLANLCVAKIRALEAFFFWCKGRNYSFSADQTQIRGSCQFFSVSFGKCVTPKKPPGFCTISNTKQHDKILDINCFWSMFWSLVWKWAASNGARTNVQLDIWDVMDNPRYSHLQIKEKS